NSFVTTYQDKGDSFKKCKIVELLDMIHDDIRQTGHDYYIGKYANSKENRDLLCTAITGYFKTIETERLLEVDQNEALIDLTAVKNWRMSNGLNTKEELESMDERELKTLNLHDNVFVVGNVSALDAMENIFVNCWID
ncbi:MAG: phage tail sheath protein, partial [Selenomonadaceae bacterium]|nr:phage tail sheath protein [Selenomonadaceae bacterium]